MYSTVDVAVLVQVIVALALNDAQRFLRGGGIVEIHQRMSVNLAVEDRKLAANRCNIVSHNFEIL